jgi:hypothetical protein
MHVYPTKFIKPKTELEVAFASSDREDEIEWYKGTVKRLNFYGHDNKGRFVNCRIDYDDGETVPDAFFYDCDFNMKLKNDSWRFVGNIAVLMSLVNGENESESSEEEAWDSSSSEDSDESDDSEASETTVISKKKCGVFGCLYKIIPVINTIMLSYITYKFLDSK